MAERKIDPSLVSIVIGLIGLSLAAVIPLSSAGAEENVRGAPGATVVAVAAEDRLGPQLAAAQPQARRVKCRRVFLFFRKCMAVASKPRRFEHADRREPVRRKNGRVATARHIEPRQDSQPGYRTLCVRTCDGYYFPISNATSQSRFKIDETACKAMNGGTPAELYVHPVEGGIAEAVSLKKKPYSSQPFAFAFQSSFQPSCQAKLHAGLARLADVAAEKAALKGVKKKQKSAMKPTPLPNLMPIPIDRIEGSEDPETIANRSGDLVAQSGKLAILHSIRRVGPQYYYAEPIRLDGLTPVPTASYGLIGPANAAQGTEPPPSH